MNECELSQKLLDEIFKAARSLLPHFVREVHLRGAEHIPAAQGRFGLGVGGLAAHLSFARVVGRAKSSFRQINLVWYQNLLEILKKEP